MQLDNNILQVPEFSIEMIEATPRALSKRSPLLFIHGAYTAAWCWQPHFLPFFADHGYHGFALSLRGHGGSAGSTCVAGWGVADYVEDVDQAIDKIKAETGRLPVLVGHSMGGFLALQVARHRSVAGLALLATVPPEGLIGSALHLFWQHPRLLWELNVVHHGDKPPRLAKLRELLFSSDLPDADLLTYASRFAPESDRALLDMTLPQFDLRPPLGHPPALVLATRDDVLMPAYLSQSAAHFLGVKADLIEGVGHLMMLDAQWHRAADAVLAWLEELP
jgi:non-heme chloroperoxidase